MNGSKKLTLLGALVALSACGSGGGGANVKGHVSDNQGSQMQSTTAGLTGLGGQGTTTAATKANAYSVAADGSLSLVASADVDAQGNYALTVPDGAEKLVIQATDKGGAVLASAIAVKAGTAANPEQLQPMTSETSLEAQVLVSMVKQGVSVDEANAIDVETRISTELAAQFAAQVKAGADISQSVASLATAIAAAEKTELAAYSKESIAVSQSAIFEAEVQAATALDAQLVGGADAQQAYQSFFTAIAQAKQSLGIDAKVQSKGERDSGAAFNLTVNAQLGGSTHPATAAIADAAIRTEAALEARTSAAAINAILAAGNASATASSAASQAVTSLKAQVGAADNVAADAKAFTTFAATVSGSANLSTSVLGTYLAVGSSNAFTVQNVVNASATAATQLDSGIDSAFTAAGGATATLDLSTLADQLATAYSSFDAAIQSEALALANYGTQAQPAVDLLIVAQGSFRVN